MSSNNDICKVEMVRITMLADNNTDTHKDNITVCVASDGSRQLKYLRIKTDETQIFTQDFRELQWISESSGGGVTTIRSSKTQIIIFFDNKNISLVKFFMNLHKSLTNLNELKKTSVDSVLSQPDPGRQISNNCIERDIGNNNIATNRVCTKKLICFDGLLGAFSVVYNFFDSYRKKVYIKHLIKCNYLKILVQLKCMINNFIQSINSGDSNEAEYLAEKLAELRVNIQFNLINKNNDDEEKNIVKSMSNTDIRRSSDSILQLTLRIECSLEKDPIMVPIEVLSGTTLRSLKEKIEEKTGIKHTDQYWFAFKRYLIPDDYIFGCLVPLISNETKQTSLGNCIRSGDTLIMYIAQMSFSD